MAKFFFDIYDGVSGLDGSGVECRDKEEACREALRRVERLLTEQADWFCTGQEWQVGVSDPWGKALLSITFKATGGCAIMVSMQAGLLVGRWNCENLDRSGRPSRSLHAPARGLAVSPADRAVRHACEPLP